MSTFCKTLSGISKDCTPNVGGIREVYLNFLQSITDIVIVNNTVTSLTIDRGFVEYQAPKDSVSYTIDLAVDQNGVDEYKHSLNFKISKRLPSKQAELENLVSGSFDYVALVKDANNLWWLLGFPFGINVQSLSGGSGTVRGDGSFYQTTLDGIQPTLELGVTEALAENILNS